MVLRYSPWRVLVWTAMFTRRMHSEAMRLLGIVTQQIVVFFPHWKVAPSLGNAEDKQTKRNAVVDIRRTSTVSSRHFSVLHFCFIWCSSTLQVLAPSRPPPTFLLNSHVHVEPRGSGFLWGRPRSSSAERPVEAPGLWICFPHRALCDTFEIDAASCVPLWPPRHHWPRTKCECLE